MKDRKTKENINSQNFSSTTISLSSFNKLDINEKNEKLRDILADAYGSRNKVKSKTLLRIINLANEKEKNIIHLENSITVENNGRELIFTFGKTKVLPIIIFYVGLLIFLSCAATFAYLGEAKRSMLNIDIDNDGVAELNIDLDNDEIADINIDTDKDNKPNENIDYMGNWTAIFNINKDGILYNQINQDLNGDGKCDINCDIDKDGWPDLNIDLDGDGKADMFIDSENEGYASLNIDINGDGKCDIQCDEDNDGKCDNYCLSKETIKYFENVKYLETIKYLDIDEKENASISSENTIPAISVLGKKVTCDDLYPTDQPEQGAKKECVTELVVKNLSTLNVKYDLYLLVGNNTYTSSNFKYKITSTNGGGNMNNYVTAPTTDTLVFKKVSISPLSTQVYNISFILEGTNAEQNYDANKKFDGEFIVKLNNN